MSRKTTLTLDQVLVEFISSIDVSKGTAASYRAVLVLFIRWLQVSLKSPDIFEAGLPDLLRWKGYLQENHRATSQRLYVTVVKRFYYWGESMGYFDNVAVKLKTPKAINGGLRRPLNVEQSKQLLNSIQRNTIIGTRDYAILNLLIINGLRLIEVCRMDLSDFYQGRQYISIQGKGQTDKSGYIRLWPHTLNAIDVYLSQRGNDNNSPLFCTHSLQNRGGTRLTPKYLSGRIRFYLDEVGLTSKAGYCAHSLRHSTASILREQGVTVDEISLKLRHSSLAVTQRYIHAISQELKQRDKPGELLENLIF